MLSQKKQKRKSSKKINKLAGYQWLMPVILATWEVDSLGPKNQGSRPA
jgi:hypothetical protein